MMSYTETRQFWGTTFKAWGHFVLEIFKKILQFCCLNDKELFVELTTLVFWVDFHEQE